MRIYIYFCAILKMIKLTVGSHFHHEAQLHRELLSPDYNSEIRPADESDNPVKVKVYPTLVRIENIDEDRGLMETTISLSMSWTDQRLKWHPIDFGSITQTHVTLDKLWKPDIGISNGIPESHVDVTRTVMAAVSSSGTVAAVLLLRSRSYCELDFTEFPFDKQTCDLQMGSWIYSYRQLIMEFWSSNKYNLSMLAPNDPHSSGLWSVQEEYLSATIYNVTHSCCPDDPFVQMEITVPIVRKPTYLLHLLITQLFIFTWLSPLMFVLPPTSRDRVVFGVLVLIGDLLNIHNLAQFTPSKSASPTIGILYIVNLYAGFAAFVASSIVTWVARHHHARTMSVCTQMVLLRLRQLFCDNKSKNHAHANGGKLITQEEQDHTMTELDTELDTFLELHEQDKPSTAKLQATPGETTGHVHSKESKVTVSASNSHFKLQALAKYLVETNQLLKDLRNRLTEYKDGQGNNDLWSELAAILDKLFAILFSMVVIVVLVILCVVAS